MKFEFVSQPHNCCDVKTNLLTCIHCKQLLCKECAQNWIGANFTYITDYYRDLNNPERTIHEWQVRNDSCPYCKQKITSEELQQMINNAEQNKK